MTRIASVKAHPISVPLKDVLWTAHEELKSSSVIVVEVRTDDGLTGYGQIHGSPMKAICAWVDRFTTIGLFRPGEPAGTNTFFLWNSNVLTAPDITVAGFGAPGDIPVAGDWNGLAALHRPGAVLAGHGG